MNDILSNIPFTGPLSIPSIDTVDPSSLQTFLIVGTIFVTIILLAIGRRYLISSSMEGVWAGFIIGVITILAFEGAIYWTAKNFVLGDRADMLPKNIRLVLEGSQHNLNQVLGVETEKKEPTAQSVALDYSLLPPIDTQLVRDSVCKE